MDILYVVGSGSTWSNNELRYSLRSIAKFGRNIERVYLAGYKPAFVSEEVRHIPCTDDSKRKHKNIMHKVLTTIEKSDISNRFLISSDDHFYIRETDFNRLPVYYQLRALPQTFSEKQLKNNYYKSLADTRSLLTKWGLPIYQTNPHCNTHFDTTLYRMAQPLFFEAMELPYGGELNCLMGNLLVSAGEKPSFFKDCKIDTFYNEEDLLQRLKDVECFSIADTAIQYGIGEYLHRLFPNKCKYEK